MPLRRRQRSDKGAVPERSPLWHRDAVGGLWDEIGRLQFEFLRAQGLRPDHHLLDVGCGSLRGGVHFVRYLDPGHYVGLDIDQDLLDAGRLELEAAGLSDRGATLVQNRHFDATSVGRRYDFALAQSLFTHLPLNSIVRCLVMLDKVLAADGRFYATFFENDGGKHSLRPIVRTEGERPIKSFFDRDPYHYDVGAFEWACEGLGLTCTYIGDWDHPRGQRMLLFARPAG